MYGVSVNRHILNLYPPFIITHSSNEERFFDLVHHAGVVLVDGLPFTTHKKKNISLKLIVISAQEVRDRVVSGPR